MRECQRCSALRLQTGAFVLVLVPLVEAAGCAAAFPMAFGHVLLTQKVLRAVVRLE